MWKKWLPIALVFVLVLFLTGLKVYQMHLESRNKILNEASPHRVDQHHHLPFEQNQQVDNVSVPKGSVSNEGLRSYAFNKEEEGAEEMGNGSMKATPPTKLPNNVRLNAPLVKQLPELPRGCEVTSLAMLLRFAGFDANKMTLAEEIKKDPTPYKKNKNGVYFGNPNEGFVGAMDTLNEPGLGVYHEPVAELAAIYLGDKVIDMTGESFNEVLTQIASGIPVWVINNTMFTSLPKEYWVKWETPEGKINVTYKEHSVLVTGYDDKWIYFNDPLTGEKNRRMKRASFIEGWEQMGRQAISYRSYDVKSVNATTDTASSKF